MNFEMSEYNRPIYCSKCGEIMIFQGVGEYKCEGCRNVELDDYGKVRAYIENHKGATAAELEKETGVKQKSIRQMLRESKIEVSSDSKVFMKCELCGKDIRSGRFCPKCEASYHHKIEEEKRSNRILQGVAMEKMPGNGEKRFKKEN